MKRSPSQMVLVKEIDMSRTEKKEWAENSPSDPDPIPV
jgi:hypothetical protein